MLADKAQTWTEMWERQGLEKGLEKGLERGLRQGRQEGESTMLLRLLEHRFGPLDEHTRQRVESADAERLLLWGERFVDATVLQDVFADH